MPEEKYSGLWKVALPVPTFNWNTVKCAGCGWAGPRSECGEEELSDRIVDLCPECGSDCE